MSTSSSPASDTPDGLTAGITGLPPRHPAPGDPDFGRGPRYHVLDYRPNDLGVALELPTIYVHGDRGSDAAALEKIAAWARDHARVLRGEGIDLTAMELEDGAAAIERYAERVGR